MGRDELKANHTETWCFISRYPETDVQRCCPRVETHITLTSWWPRWRLKSPASRMFTQPFIQTQIKENIKAPRHWPLCGEFTGTGEFPAQRASYAENVSIWWCHHDLSLSDIIVIGPMILFPVYGVIGFKAHSPLDTVPQFSQTIFSEAFREWIDLYFDKKNHRSLFPRTQLTMIQHWFIRLFGPKPLFEPTLTRFIDAYMRR